MKLPVILCLCLLSCANCGIVLNAVSFFPDKNDPVADSLHLPPDIRPLCVTTPDHEKLSCYYLSAQSNRLVVYYHGNAQNIDMRLPELHKLRVLGINVLGVGYRGYGKSTGRPSETGIYCDGEAALKYAIDSLGFSAENIVLCGRSIGTTVAVNTAQRRNLKGVILITPLSNGREFAKSHHIGLLSWFLGNPFDNLAKCKNISAPVLIIHGTEDETVPYELGVRLFEAWPGKKAFVTIRNGRHNNLEHVDSMAYWGSIKDFLAQ